MQNSSPINRLITTVVQTQDFDNAVNALTAAGLSVTHISSVGGFLGRRNVTLLVGLNENDIGEAVEILRQSCRRRVEYVTTPLEGGPFNMPLSTPITIGGATIFTFAVEHFEEIQ